jgi:hypothetical protein
VSALGALASSLDPSSSSTALVQGSAASTGHLRPLGPLELLVVLHCKHVPQWLHQLNLLDLLTSSWWRVRGTSQQLGRGLLRHPLRSCVLGALTQNSEPVEVSSRLYQEINKNEMVQLDELIPKVVITAKNSKGCSDWLGLSQRSADS